MALTGKSGMFELSGTNGITAQFTWSETYDVGSNTSIISIDSVKVKSSLYENVEYFPNGSITVDGTAVVTFRSSSGTHDVYIDNLNRYYELDGSPAAPWKSGAVLHNADGSKAAVIGVDIFFATLSGGSGHGAKISANKSVELTQIPRASAIKEAAATTLGGYCAVKWTPLASAFRYRVKLSLGTWSLDSGILYPASTAEYTYRAIIPLEVANQIPNSPSGTMTASLLTYSDSKGAVQIGNTDTETFVVTVPNNSDTQPDPGMTLQAVSTLPSKFAGLYIQGKTKVDANFAGSGKYKATVKSYGMLVDGKSYASPYTSGYLAKTGNVEVVGTATDSRGYSGKQTSSIYVIPYADPKVQTSICGRCDAGGNLSDSGTRLRIKVTRSYSKVVDEAGKSYNTCGIQYRYAQAGGSYGNWVTILANGSGSDTVDTGAISGITLAVDMSYLVQIRALDDIGGEAMTTVSLPTAKVFMHRNGPKNSVGFGGYENDPNTVSIAEDMTFHVKGTAKGITAAMVGAMAPRPLVAKILNAAGWYRIGTVNVYFCHRLTVSTRYGGKMDMGAIVDIVATYARPALNKTAAAFTADTVKQIDQIRLVTNTADRESFYYVDIHYNYDTANTIFVRLDGPDGMWTTYADWPKVSDADTAACTLAL